MEKEAKENLDEDLNKEGAMGLGEQTEAVHEMKERIQDLVNILSDFRRKRDPSISREQYMDRLRSYCAKFYW